MVSTDLKWHGLKIRSKSSILFHRGGPKTFGGVNPWNDALHQNFQFYSTGTGQSETLTKFAAIFRLKRGTAGFISETFCKYLFCGQMQQKWQHCFQL